MLSRDKYFAALAEKGQRDDGRKADQISWSFYVVVGNCARRSDICPQANPLGGEVHIDLEIVLFMVFPAKRFKIMRSLI